MGNEEQVPAARKAEMKGEPKSCAPQPVANVAASLGRQLYYEVLSNVRPPKDHRIVPEVTVMVSYHFESESTNSA